MTEGNPSVLTVTTTAMDIRSKELTAVMGQWIFRFPRIANLRLNHMLSANVRRISHPLTRKSSLWDIYGFEASEGFISDVTDKIPRLKTGRNVRCRRFIQYSISMLFIILSGIME